MSQKTEEERKAAEEAESSSGLTWFVVGLLALAGVLGIFAFARTVLPEGGSNGFEAPLCSIMLEVNAFDLKTRTEIEELERDLVATGVLEELGPGSPSTLYLVPAGVNSFDVRTLRQIGDDEWPMVWSFMPRGDWLVPRFFRIDGTACVIRVGPKPQQGGVRFTPEVADRLKEVIEKHRPAFKAVHAYSHLGGIGEVADRDAINVSFGVQTAWVKVRHLAPPGSKPPTMLDVGSINMLLSGAKPALMHKDPAFEKKYGIRSVVTPASWAVYAYAVKNLAQKDPDLPRDENELKSLFDFARSRRINTLLTPDNAEAMVEVSTTAEGEANAELPYYMNVTFLETMKNVEVTGVKTRPLKYRQKPAEDEK
jgi:hypothetical protein